MDHAAGNGQPGEMQIVQQTIRKLARGMLCGAVGGFAAGLMFGTAMTVYSLILFGYRIDSLYDLVLPYIWSASIVGTLGGFVLGAGVETSLALVRPHLLLISQIVGGLSAAFVSLFVLNSDLSELWIAIIVGSALLAGVLGGTAASRTYIWLYES